MKSLKFLNLAQLEASLYLVRVYMLLRACILVRACTLVKAYKAYKLIRADTLVRYPDVNLSVPGLITWRKNTYLSLIHKISVNKETFLTRELENQL